MSRQIFLDMDGVIVDLQCPLKDMHNFDVNLAFHRHELQLTEEQLWGKTDAGWWAGLPWMPDGRGILAVCEDAVGPENVIICSTPANWPGSADGKLRWIREQMPNYARRFVLTPNKSCCANARTLLIDDYASNCLAFRQAGGASLLCPRPWNCECDPQDSAVDYLRSRMEEMLE